MNGHPKLPVKIIEIEPVTVYEGTVYDQTVLVRVQEETEFRLFDKYPVSVEDSTIGDDVNASVSVIPKSGVRIASDETVGIYPPANPSSEWSYDFVGKILNLNTKNRYFILDIEIGSVRIGLNDNTRNVVDASDTAPSNQLYVPATRTDLVEIS